MKTTTAVKLTGLLVMVLALTVGCAGTPEQQASQPSQDTCATAGEAIAAAKAALKRAEDEGYAWRDTGKLIKKAEDAQQAGDCDKALDLANEARRQSEIAVQQKYEELNRIKPMLQSGAAESTGGASSQYTVERGDSLWAISGKQEIYGNPYEWPLIYKANQDKIQDADLIYPGQVFDIEQNPSQDDVDAAVQHAKTRGAWTLGETEASDRSYLGR